jgi:hypothetical protein
MNAIERPKGGDGGDGLTFVDRPNPYRPHRTPRGALRRYEESGRDQHDEKQDTRCDGARQGQQRS